MRHTNSYFKSEYTDKVDFILVYLFLLLVFIIGCCYDLKFGHFLNDFFCAFQGSTNKGYEGSRC